MSDLAIDLYSDLGANHFMTTHGAMRNGHIDAQTRTQTKTWFGGFHGSVQIFVADAAGITIGNTKPATFGVEGTWIGRSDRTEYWSDDLDPDVANRTTSLHVVHFWDPQYQALQRIAERALVTGRPIVELLKDAKGLGADSK